MVTITQEELNEILEKHQHWLKEDCEGWENMRADLHDVNLNYIDLCNANLRYADLHGANINYTDFSYTDFRGADLRGVNLYNVIFYNTNLQGANLQGANLRNVNFYEADLRDTNLRDIDIYNVNFHGANFCGAKNVPFIPYYCPDSDSFIGYKKARDGIVKLEILPDARRCSAAGRKCRCDKAKVLGIYDNEYDLLDIKETVSRYDKNFRYIVGEIVEEPDFCEDRWNECSKGIHFFMTFQEAVNY